MTRAAFWIAILMIAATGVAQEQPADTAAEMPRNDSDSDGTGGGQRPLVSSTQKPADGATPLRFRRVYLPEKELLERTNRHERYLPMDAAEFDARLRRLQVGDRKGSEFKAGIAYGSYQARLNSNFQLIGKGAWRVKLAGTEGALLPLTGLGIAVSDPRWQKVGNSSALGGEARLGATDAYGPALYATQSGTVEFNWSLAGTQDREGTWTYALAFPPSAAHRIELALPAHLRPSIDGAIISQTQLPGTAEKRWTIDLAGRSKARLKLISNTASKVTGRRARLRPRLTYELSPLGLRLSAEWRLDVYDEPIRQLELDLDRQLKLLSVHVSNQAVPWSETGKAAESGAKRIVLEFPEPLRGANRLVRLIAVAPLKTATAWRLPNLSARDVVWQDGTMALVIAAPLSLDRLDLTHCRQSQRQSLPPPASGEVLGFQAFSPSATMTVHVAPQSERLELSSGTTIELAANEAIATYVAQISARQGERLKLTADISPDWVIDSVQSSPGDVISDWNRERGPGSGTRLAIQLTKAINRDRPLQLVVRATRRRAPLGDTLDREDLRLLNFDNVVAARRLALLKAASPFRLEVRGADELSRLDPSQLEAGDRDLLRDIQDGLLFVDDEFAGDLQISLAAERPRWSAFLRTRVVVAEQYVEESSELNISPESDPLERLLVHFSQAREEELAWTLDNGDSQELVARRLDREEQKQRGIGAGGETWEVQLRPARSEPFALRAARRVQVRAEMPVSLPSLVDATSQQGQVVVELASEYAPQLVERRLRELAIEPPAPGEFQNLLAAYAYDPSEDLLVAKEPALLLSIDREALHRRPAWVWRCSLDAWFSASRHAHYRARFWIENAGRSRLSIMLPADGALTDAPPSVTIDGATSDEVAWNRETQELLVPLPPSRRYSLIDVGWEGNAAGLGGISRPRLHWPTADVPILDRDAAVWLPAGYLLADSGAASAKTPKKRVSWCQRLFGPLGRPGAQQTFEPWLAADWSRLISGPGDDVAVWSLANRFAAQTLSGLAAAGTAAQEGDSAASQSTWGDQLYRAWYGISGQETSSAAPLLVHQPSLAAAGIRAASTIRADSSAETTLATIGELLDQHNLVLLVLRRSAVLCTRDWAASWCDASIATSREIVVRADSQDLSQLPMFAGSDAAVQWIPLSDWQDRTEGVLEVWPQTSDAASNGMHGEGWVAYPLECPSNVLEFSLLVVRRQTLMALSIGVFLAMAGTSWRISGRPAFIRILALAVAVMVALLIPVAFAPLGAAAVLGFLGGQGCRLIFPPTATERLTEMAPRPVAAVTATLLVAAAFWSVAVVAQESSSIESQYNAAAIYDVLIPIDEKQQPKGDKVYVPEVLYWDLMANPLSRPQEDRYLITSARYDATAPTSIDRSLAMTGHDWKAFFTVEVLRSPARVLLPIGARIVPDSGKLNGAPLLFGWDEARETFFFDVTEAGEAEVEFAFRPARSGDSAPGSFSFAIPAIPQSTLRLDAAGPAEPPHVQALGASQAVAGSKQIVAELGPIDRIVANLGERHTQTEPAPQFDSEELLWLRVRPGSAILNARFTIQVRRGAVSEVPILFDERLLPLPMSAESAVDKIVRISSGKALLRLKTPITDRASIDLSFGLEGASGQATFPWPQLRLVGATTSERYIACSVDPSLELLSPVPDGMKPMDAGRFAVLWGDPEARPLAFQLGDGDPHWRLEIVPRQAKLTSTDRSILELSSTHARLFWRAAINISNGSRYQLRVAVPEELEIDRVEVRDAAGVRPNRRAVSGDGLLTIFPDAAATGKVELHVSGQLPVGGDGRLAVPLLQVADAVEESGSLYVLRRSNVSASIEALESFREIPGAEPEAVFSELAAHQFHESSNWRRLHLVAAVEAPASRGSVLISVQKNQPHIVAMQAMSLTRQADVWQAALDMKLNVSAGELDVVRIDAPSWWTGPFHVQPEAPLEVMDLADDGRRQLWLYPPQGIAGEARFRIEGQLLTTAGQRIRAPDARILGAAELQQYFALPRQQELQSLSWETRGLKPGPIPQALLPQADGRMVLPYLKVSDEMRAELRSVEKIADDVQIRLADFALRWNDDSSCMGAAVFDIEPAGRKNCRMAMPAGYRLIHLSVDGRPLRIVPAGDQRWQVPLSGGRLPQRIELVFTGELAKDNASSKLFEGPRLIGLPVERTLWTVSGPAIAGAAKGASGDSLSPVALEATRFESIAGLIESAAGTLAELQVDQTARWYAAWARRMLASRASLSPSTDSTVESAKTDLLEQDHERLAERLGTYDLLAMLWEDPSPAESPIATWNESLGRSHGAWRGVFLGETPSLELAYSSPVANDLAARVFQVLLAATFLFLTALAMRYSRIVEWFGGRPRAVGVAVGVFWWLCLWPSAAGWLIVAATIGYPTLRSLVRRQWRWRRSATARLT